MAYNNKASKLGGIMNRSYRHFRNLRGYTLVELVAVISIISILAMIALPGLTGYASVAKKQADKQTVALAARAIAIAMASNDIPYASDKLTLTGSNGQMDKYESIMVSLLGEPEYRKLLKANRAEFNINADGSIEYTIMWFGGLIVESETFNPEKPPESPPETPIVPTFMLNVTSGIGGSTSGSGIYEEGSLVTISATADGGYKFVEWIGSVGDSTSSNTTYVVPSNNSTVTASFELIEIHKPSSPGIAFTNQGNKNSIRITGQSGASVDLYYNNIKIETKQIPANQTTVTFNSPNKGSYKATQSVAGQESSFSLTIIK